MKLSFLRKELLALELHVVQATMAVCWYGRRYGSQGFERDLQHARNMIHDIEAHATYVISNLQHLGAGLARIENDRLNQQSESADD